jgi:hypothetical protein
MRIRSYANCIIFAFLLFRRLERKGHRVYHMKRKSDWGNFSHRLVGIQRGDKVRLVSYKPVNPKKRRFPPPLFAGRVRWGDG